MSLKERSGLGEFIEAQRACAKMAAEAGVGELSERELLILDVGFAYGMETVNKANEIVKRVFEGDK